MSGNTHIHRVPPPALSVYRQGDTPCENAQYAGVPPVFYRVNSRESGCYNSVKKVAYMLYYADLYPHTFGSYFFCYKTLYTSPILRIVECIKEMVTTYIIKGLSSHQEVFQKKITKKSLYEKESINGNSRTQRVNVYTA